MLNCLPVFRTFLPLFLLLVGQQSRAGTAVFLRGPNTPEKTLYQVRDHLMTMDRLTVDLIRHPRLDPKALSLSPDGVVVVLDGRSLEVARSSFNTQPLFYTSVSPKDIPGAVGLFSMISPEQLITRLKTLHPSLKSVGVMRSRSDHSKKWVLLKTAFQKKGVQLVIKDISTETEVNNAVNQLIADVDLIWLVQKEAFLPPSTVASVLTEAHLKRIVVAGYSREHLKASPPAALVISPSSVDRVDVMVTMITAMASGQPVESRYQPVQILARRTALREVGVVVNKHSAVAVDEWVN